jgi:quinol monooxygenase YgiN
MIHLTGTLTCPTENDLKIVEQYLPDHTRLSRAEPGCLSFNVTQTANPLVWQLDETYVDQAAFDAHQTRNRASTWWTKSQNLVRDFKITDA